MKYLLLLVLFMFPFFSYSQFGEQQIIDGDIASSWSIYVVDIDGDGSLDVLASEELDSKLVWYKNLDGLGTFGEQLIIANNLEYTRYISAADIDGDGDMDVLAISLSNDLVVWYRNEDGLGSFGSQQIITTALDLPIMIIAEDVDDDGALDVIIASKNDNKVTWFRNEDGLGNFGNQQNITNSALTSASIFFADIDGDGFGDIISDSSSNNFPCWFKNLDGLGNFGSQQEITTDTFGSQYVLADDVDNDGDMDVLNVEFGGETIAWYENTDGLGTFGPKQVITGEVNAPRQIFMADLDNDADNDIIYNTSEVVDPDYLAWRANDGHGNFGEEQVISTEVVAPRGLFAADVDNDGDLDVFSSSIADSKIAWYENLTILGVDETLQLKIKVYPNPANTLLYISNSSTYNINSLQITDLQGKTVKHVNKNTSQLDISNLESGVYFVNVTTDKGSLVKKIIKQ